WLDDQRSPGSLPSYQTAEYADVQWTWVKTGPAFRQLLQKHSLSDIGFMALDHDLGVCEECMRKMEEILKQHGGGWLGPHPPEAVAFRNQMLIREPDKVSYSSCIHNEDGTA